VHASLWPVSAPEWAEVGPTTCGYRDATLVRTGEKLEDWNYDIKLMRHEGASLGSGVVACLGEAAVC
jgi:hypothetical protein